MKQFLKRNWTVICRIIVGVIICWLITGGNFYIIAVVIFFLFIKLELDLISRKLLFEKIDLLEERIELLKSIGEILQRVPNETKQG